MAIFPLAISQLPSLILSRRPVALATRLLARWPSTKGRQASLRRGLRHKTKPAIDQRWIATAPVATIAYWGLGRLLWHQPGLQLKELYHAHGHSSATNESRNCSKAAATVGTRTACLAFSWEYPGYLHQQSASLGRWATPWPSVNHCH